MYDVLEPFSHQSISRKKELYEHNNKKNVTALVYVEPSHQAIVQS